MKLNEKQIDRLLQVVGVTNDQEIDCGQCHAVIAEFAEHQLTGQSIPQGLEVVKHHLSICTDCSEEYELLQKALQSLIDE